MQNDKVKCGLTEIKEGKYIDDIPIDAYVWFEENWEHDEYEHKHTRYQLTYVAEGYQYFHIEKKIYLVPQNHIIWIPTGKEHRTTSEAKMVHLMVVLFNSVPDDDFYKNVHVSLAPTVLKEMLLYAAKWNKVLIEDNEQQLFLKAMLQSLPNFCEENNGLQIPVPTDSRLIPICNYINTNYKSGFDSEDLATKAKMSVRTLQRIFKHETGITLQKYVQLIRILKSIELIDSQQYTLSEIAYQVGYQSLSAFTSSYSSIMKTKPKLKKDIFKK